MIHYAHHGGVYKAQPGSSLPTGAVVLNVADPSPRAEFASPATRHAPPSTRQIDPWTIITAEQLVRDTLELTAELPSSIDAVAAAARSGLIPGSLLSAHLHVPLYAVSRVHGVVDPGHGYRMGHDFQPYPTEPSHLLVIDDTAATGHEMPACTARVRERFPAAKITRAVIYCHPQAAAQVDLFHSLYTGQHYLEWNWPNAGHSDTCVYDWDGILCSECPADDDDDGPRYKRHLSTAKPLHLPRRRPIPMIVSARHDRYRDLCLEWLARHRVQIGGLVLRDWDYDRARSLNDQVGEWKAAVFSMTSYSMFAESSPAQAQVINRLTGRRVLCPALGRVLPPSTVHAPRSTLRGGCCH